MKKINDISERISPWEGILSEIRRASYRAEWIDEHVDRACTEYRELERRAVTIRDIMGETPEAEREYRRAVLDIQSDLRAWTESSRRERDHLVKTCERAIRAGLSERLVYAARVDGERISGVMSRAVEAAGLSESQRSRLHEEILSALSSEADVWDKVHSLSQADTLPGLLWYCCFTVRLLLADLEG